MRLRFCFTDHLITYRGDSAARAFEALFLLVEEPQRKIAQQAPIDHIDKLLSKRLSFSRFITHSQHYGIKKIRDAAAHPHRFGHLEAVRGNPILLQVVGQHNQTAVRNIGGDNGQLAAGQISKGDNSFFFQNPAYPRLQRLPGIQPFFDQHT
ncbi:hypothetical protein D3C81_1652200 [compost metagenome]